jgi:uncharacterized protein with ParB-like and HNH nuclease domain
VKKSKIKHNDKYTLKNFLISFSRYTVPSFQRKYTWAPKQIVELWNSILTNEPNYYIGTIVGIQNVDHNTRGQVIEIIDGQQRITTLSILCLALRNYINDFGTKKGSTIKDPDGKARHFDNFLSDTDSLRDSSVKNTRLKFNKPGLNEIYEGLVNGLPKAYNAITDKEEFSNLNDSQQVFIKNYKRCLSLIKEYIAANQNTDINDLITDIGDRIGNVEFIAIITESDTDVYQLFEGLNSTAKPLSEVDLTKNAVLKSLSGKHNSHLAIKKAEELWEELEEEFDVVNIKWLDNFLRHQWIAENGYINTSELFEQIKKIKLGSESTASALNYIMTLRDDAKSYVGLRTSNSKYLGKKFQNDSPKVDIRRYRQSILDKLELMSILGLGQVYEVLLSIFKKFEISSNYTSRQLFNDVEKLWFFSWAVSNLSISPSKYEKDFADFCSKITKYSGKDYNKLSQSFFNRLHLYIKNGETDFIDSFKESSKFKEDSGRKKLIKYILYIHYGNKYRVDGKHLLKFESIDHVFPKNKKVWGNHELGEHIHMIGNLCLLDSADNGKLQDLTPSDKYKKQVYKEDPFKYNSWIVKKFDEWEKEPVKVIGERSNEVAREIFSYISKKISN